MLGFEWTTTWMPNAKLAHIYVPRRGTITVTGCYWTKCTFLGETISNGPDEGRTVKHYTDLEVQRREKERQADIAARQAQAKSADDFRDVLSSFIKDGKDGVVATISNTFDNGYTSVWHYKVKDGELMVQKPYGNQARAVFDSVATVVALVGLQDHRRHYLLLNP